MFMGIVHYLLGIEGKYRRCTMQQSACTCHDGNSESGYIVYFCQSVLFSQIQLIIGINLRFKKRRIFVVKSSLA